METLTWQFNVSWQNFFHEWMQNDRFEFNNFRFFRSDCVCHLNWFDCDFDFLVLLEHVVEDVNWLVVSAEDVDFLRQWQQRWVNDFENRWSFGCWHFDWNNDIRNSFWIVAVEEVNLGSVRVLETDEFDIDRQWIEGNEKWMCWLVTTVQINVAAGTNFEDELFLLEHIQYVRIDNIGQWHSIEAFAQHDTCVVKATDDEFIDVVFERWIFD